MTAANGEGRWLLLIHQIPPRPAYLRVRMARRLARAGAVAIKNTVYALPAREQSHEDFQWVLREIVQGGGEASVAEARMIEGLRDRDLEDLFNRARNADYQALAAAARTAPDPVRLRRRLAEITAIDFFGAPGRAAAERAVAEARTPPAKTAAGKPADPAEYRRRTWVTREGVGIDRMASAWLIRRFIDPAARFKFVPAKGYRPRPREVRFDMFEAEFTHEGELCTFEVLLKRMRIADAALRPLAELIHDIDLKDQKYRREEAKGLERLVDGIRLAHPDDRDRLARGGAVFEDLHALFSQKGGRP